MRHILQILPEIVNLLDRTSDVYLYTTLERIFLHMLNPI